MRYFAERMSIGYQIFLTTFVILGQSIGVRVYRSVGVAHHLITPSLRHWVVGKRRILI